MNNDEKKERQNLVVNCFKENPTFTMLEVSKFTGISKSTVQRILNKNEVALCTIPLTGRTIKEQLAFNLIKGRQKGGKNSFQNNLSQKDQSGKFIGCVINYDLKDNEFLKQADVELIVKYYCYNPNETLEQLAENINTTYNKKYTKDYVYDCLLDPRVEMLFGKIVSDEIKNQLSNNAQGFFRKFEFLSMDIQTLSQYDLTDKEIAVLVYRFNDGKIRSTAETAEHFDCSKTVITNIENSALKKINAEYDKEESKHI